MIGVLEAGEGTALASLITYIIIFLLPVLIALFGVAEWRRKTVESQRVAKAMFVIAGLSLLVIIAFFVFTAV